jgi:integrase
MKKTRQPGQLAAVAIKTLKDGWHSDGGNLYLFVRGSSRAWVFRYLGSDGKRKHMGLGSILSLSLSEARKVAATLREQIKHPINPVDPIAEKRERRQQQIKQQRSQMTFKACAEAYINAHKAEWKNEKHGQQWENTLSTFAYPVFGDLSVDLVDEGLVLKVLMPIWEKKTETAKRLRGRIESVLDWATFNKYRQGENPARWKGHLEHSLAKPSKVAKVIHHAALPHSQVADFMKTLATVNGIGARALEFLILTAARSGEVRGATWSEIDLDQKLWVIPSSRMKMQREHRVALSDAAIDLLRSLKKIEGTELIFPSAQKQSQMSDMTLTAVLRRLERTDITVHGFRSTFRDWAAEATNYPSEVAEMALAHVVSNKVEAAYRRGDLLAKRFELMQDWADFCLKSGELV